MKVGVSSESRGWDGHPAALFEQGPFPLHYSTHLFLFVSTTLKQGQKKKNNPVSAMIQSVTKRKVKSRPTKGQMRFIDVEAIGRNNSTKPQFWQNLLGKKK